MKKKYEVSQTRRFALSYEYYYLKVYLSDENNNNFNRNLVNNSKHNKHLKLKSFKIYLN